MSDTTENTKDAIKPAQTPAPNATRPTISTVVASGSAADLLKQAVSTARPKPIPEAGASPAGKTPLGVRYAAIAASAVVLGTVFGLVAAPKPASVETLGAIQTALEASRADASRLNGDVERLGQALATLRETNETARSESRTLDTRVAERVSALEQNVGKKLAGISETIDRAQREQTAQLVAQIEKRSAAPAPVPAAPAASVAVTKVEPATTGTIADARQKIQTIEAWAVRDVFAGVALLEDRKRHLIEVGRGDVVPGVGRVEAVEKRGRSWVVVLRQGVITPQAW